MSLEKKIKLCQADVVHHKANVLAIVKPMGESAGQLSGRHIAVGLGLAACVLGLIVYKKPQVVRQGAKLWVTHNWPHLWFLRFVL